MILPAPALVLSTDLDQARGWFWVLGFRVGCHRCGPKRPTRQSGAANHRHPHRRGATGGHSDGGVWIWTRQQCPPVARGLVLFRSGSAGGRGCAHGPVQGIDREARRHSAATKERVFRGTEPGSTRANPTPAVIQVEPARRTAAAHDPARSRTCAQHRPRPSPGLVLGVGVRGWAITDAGQRDRSGNQEPPATDTPTEVRRQRGTPMFLDRRPGWRDQAHQGRPGAHQCYRPASGGASERNEPQGRTCRMATMSSADTTNVSSSPITAPPAETQTATPVHQGQGGVQEANDHRRRLIKAHPASTGVSRLHGHSAEINRAETASFVRPKTPHNPFPLRNLTPNLTLYKW